MPWLGHGIHSMAVWNQHECYGMDRMVKPCDDHNTMSGRSGSALDHIPAHVK